MEPGEYEGLVAKASAGSPASAIELLQAMRAHKIHQPEFALLHGGRLLEKNPGKLGTEVWTVMEQVFFAAVELGADDWRDYCLKSLQKQFPNSKRVERLKGIHQESKGDWNGAKVTYEALLKEKPEDCITAKRLMSMHKQRGKNPEAVEAMIEYLDRFSTDSDVWHELAELYISQGSLQRAVFCFEELVCANPRSLYNVLTYAELLYTTNDMELSRKYFSLASYMDGSCLRALWGLYVCNLALKEKDRDNEKMEQLQQFTVDRLKAAYKPAGAHGKVAIGFLLAN